MKGIIRVATRGSTLALTQTRQLVQQLITKNPTVQFEIIVMKTLGDRVTDRPLSSFRGIGVFVKELQNALFEQRADLAIHSLKDVPTEQHNELILAGFPQRLNPNDLLLTNSLETVATLKAGSRVGTSSPRRMVQLKAANRLVHFSDLRGNLDTRLGKLTTGEFDGIVVAAAGMIRLDKQFEPKSILPVDVCIPAVGQGILAIECRKDDQLCIAIASSINHRNTQIEAEAERYFLHHVGGGCAMPIAAHAVCENGFLNLTAMIGDIHTFRIARSDHRVSCENHLNGARELAGTIMTLCKEKGISVDI